jgi:hypothetical protein
MHCLYQKIGSVGYTKPYIHSLLPEWWDDAIATTPAGFQQASLIMGRLFSIQPETLWTEAAEPLLIVPQGRKFKQRTNTQSQELDIACALARSAACLALKAFKPELAPGFYPDAAELRQRLLSSGNPWISFQNLLAHCLKSGIPVIFLNHFPGKAKKMAGVSFELDGRPIIVLTQIKPYGYLLFDLAHELGHITLGHTQGGAWVVDAKIDADSSDEEEQAANRFALELLTGIPDCKFVPVGRQLDSRQLAIAANRLGEAEQIDPLHITLNYGHSSKQWAVATETVKLIAKNQPTDQQILKQMLLAALDLESIHEDDLMTLNRLMGKDIA